MIQNKFDAYVRDAERYLSAGLRSMENGDRKEARAALEKTRTILFLSHTPNIESNARQEQQKAKVYPFDPSGATKSLKDGLRSVETRRKLPPGSDLLDRESPRL
jgi:hypothetical protein